MPSTHNAAPGRPVTVYFRHRDLVRLDQAARRLGISRSDLVRIAVDARVAAILEGPQPERVETFIAETRRRVGASLVSIAAEERTE